MLRSHKIIALIAGILSLSGCASIVHGTNQKLTITSRPPHASVTVDGAPSGQAPVQVNLKRKQDHTIKLHLTGYQPATIHLKSSVSGWVFGNIVFGSLIGIVIDAVDGAMYKLTPQQMSAYTEKSKKKNTITVVMVKSANKNWNKIGQLKKS